MAKIYGAEYTSVTIATNVTLQMVHGVPTSDEITIAESISYFVDPMDLSVNSAVVIAEELSFTTHPYEAVVSDSISSDDTFLTVGRSLLEVSVIDTITIGDDGSYQYGFYDLTVNTSVVSETYVFVVNVGMVSDSVSVATSVTLFIPVLLLDEYTEVAIEDTYTRVLAQLTVHDSIYVRSIFNESLSDTELGIVASTITSVQTIFASAKRTATVGTYVSEAFKVASAIALRFHINVTAETGTSTLNNILQTSPDGEVWYDITTMSVISATGNSTGTLTHPGVWARVKSVISGTDMTYSCLMTKHMPKKSRPRWLI